MRSRPPSEWTAATITARDLVHDSRYSVVFNCRGCQGWREFNIWKVGKVLADTPLQSLRFRCRRCGVYPRRLHISQSKVGISEDVLVVDLQPRAWDDEHREAQAIAIERAEWRRRAEEKEAG